jgi:hypothetical protein
VVSLGDYVHAANNGGLTDDLVLAFVDGEPSLQAVVVDTLSGMGESGHWYAVALDRARESEDAHREDRINRLRRALWGPEVSAILFEGDPVNPINLPERFWDQSEILAHIRQLAWHRMLSGDSVLGAVLCRVAWRCWPDVTLPPIVAAPGSLDLCVALVGPSGSGKTAAMWAASELIDAPTMPNGHPHPAFEEWPAGSGEGIIEAYLGETEEEDGDGNKHRVKTQTKKGVFFSLDEGAALRSIAGRSGATILQTIRSAWSGAMLGAANARSETTRRLAARSYRFVLIAGFQPGAASILLGADETDGGTPQRWQWLSLTDPRTPGPLDTPEHPGPLPTMGGPIGLAPGDEITVDFDIQHEIRVRRHAKVTGAAAPDPLNEHRDLARLKVAALMSILHGRTHVDHWAWTMAGYLMDTSESVRTRILEVSVEQQRAKIAELQERAAATALTVDDARTARALNTVAEAATRHVQRISECGPPHTSRCIAKSVNFKLRQLVDVDDAIEVAFANGWIVRDGAGWR